MNISNKIRALSLATLLAVPFSPAMSGEFYLGVGAGSADYKDINCPTGFDCDTSDTGWKLLGGYQFTPIFGVEAAWADLGEVTLNGTAPGGAAFSGKGEGDGFLLAGTVGWPATDRFRLYGKLGGFFYNSKFTSTVGGVVNEDLDESGTELMYGLGAQYNFTERFGARLEWERFNDIDPKSVNQGPFDIDYYSISLLVLFP